MIRIVFAIALCPSLASAGYPTQYKSAYVAPAIKYAYYHSPDYPGYYIRGYLDSNQGKTIAAVGPRLPARPAAIPSGGSRGVEQTGAVGGNFQSRHRQGRDPSRPRFEIGTERNGKGCRDPASRRTERTVAARETSDPHPRNDRLVVR